MPLEVDRSDDGVAAMSFLAVLVPALVKSGAIQKQDIQLMLTEAGRGLDQRTKNRLLELNKGL